jgi:hypothetical protein
MRLFNINLKEVFVLRKIFSSVFSFLLAFTLLMPTSFANETNDINSAMKEAEQIVKYLSKDAQDFYIFDAESAKKDGLSEKLIHQTKTTFNKVNENKKNNKKNLMKASCKGKNAFTSGGVYLDSCAASDLAAALSVGGGTSGAIAIILAATGLGSIPAAAVGSLGAVLGLGGTVINAAARKGCGIFLDFFPPSARPQC